MSPKQCSGALDSHEDRSGLYGGASACSGSLHLAPIPEHPCPQPVPTQRVALQRTPKGDAADAAYCALGTDAEAAHGFARFAAALRCFGRLRMPYVKIYSSEIGTGSWRDLLYAITVVVATPATFATLPYAMARLQWTAGLLTIVLLWAASCYNSFLLAELQQWTVTMRFCRYRDLAKSIWGQKGFFLAFFFQQLGAISNNIAIQVASAVTMKQLHEDWHPGGLHVSVFAFIAAYGGFQLLLCQIPTLRQMRHLNAAAVLLTAAFVAVIVAACITEGKELDRSKVSHQLSEGSQLERTMQAFKGLGVIAYSFSNPILPELQSIVAPPAVANSKRGIAGAMSFMLGMYVPIAAAGYWAFGRGVSQLVVLDFSAQDGWMPTTAQVLLVVVSTLNWQLYARPTLEIIDYLLQDDLDENLMSPCACLSRLAGSAVYVLTIGFVSSMLPTAVTELAAMVGVIGYAPLSLVFPPLLYITAQQPGRIKRRLLQLLAAVSTIAAVCAFSGACYTLVRHLQSEDMRLFTDAAPRTALLI